MQPSRDLLSLTALKNGLAILTKPAVAILTKLESWTLKKVVKTETLYIKRHTFNTRISNK